jgi:hypothetical protein
MSILILVCAIVSLILLCINICTEYKCSDIIKRELPLSSLSLVVVSAIFNISYEFDSNNLYKPKESNMVIVKCTNIGDDNVKYTCKIANENGEIGKHFRFVDDIGKYNIGDTITFNIK